MIDLKEYFYKKVKGLLDERELSDAYPITFLFIQMKPMNIGNIQTF